MKMAALVILAAPLALAACATQPSEQVLEAHARRGVKECIANGWMHDGVILIGPFTSGETQGDRADRYRRGHHARGVNPIPGGADIGRIEQRCR